MAPLVPALVPWYREPATLAAIVTAAATFAYVLGTFLLWRATKKAAEAAKQSADASSRTADFLRESFVSSSRPYIGVHSCERDAPRDPAWRVVVTVRNYGRLPTPRATVSVQFFNRGVPVGGEIRKACCEIFPDGNVVEAFQFRWEPDWPGPADILARITVLYEVPGDGEHQHTSTWDYIPDQRTFLRQSTSTVKVREYAREATGAVGTARA